MPSLYDHLGPMEDSRPSNPTPLSGRTFTNSADSKLALFDGFSDPQLEVPAPLKKVRKQPSLSDLLKANVISLDGVKTPSISELMDFDISPGDLLPENDPTCQSKSNNEGTDTPKIHTSTENIIVVKGGYLKTSPMKPSRPRRVVDKLYQTWNASENRKKRAVDRGLPVKQFEASPPKSTQRRRRPVNRNEKLGMSVTGKSPTRQTQHFPQNGAVGKDDRTAALLSNMPPRPSGPLPFSSGGRRSAWDSSSSDDGTDDDDDRDFCGVEATQKQTTGEAVSPNAIVKLKKALASSEVDMISSRIIRLCVIKKKGTAPLENALALFNHLLANGVILKLPGVYKSIIMRCCKEKNVVQALHIFDCMCQASVQFDVELWECLNRALVNGGMIEKAAALLSNMRWKNLSPKPEFYVVTMLACITIGKIGLADALLDKCKEEIPMAFLHHLSDVCTTLLSNWKLAGYRARETSILEFIGKVDYLIDLRTPIPENSINSKTLPGSDEMPQQTMPVSPDQTDSVNEWDDHFIDPENSFDDAHHALKNLERVLSNSSNLTEQSGGVIH